MQKQRNAFNLQESPGCIASFHDLVISFTQGGVGLVHHPSHVVLQFLAAHFQLQDEQNARVNALQ